jgi:hypothetical protein
VFNGRIWYDVVTTDDDCGAQATRANGRRGGIWRTVDHGHVSGALGSGGLGVIDKWKKLAPSPCR